MRSASTNLNAMEKCALLIDQAPWDFFALMAHALKALSENAPLQPCLLDASSRHICIYMSSPGYRNTEILDERVHKTEKEVDIECVCGLISPLFELSIMGR